MLVDSLYTVSLSLGDDISYLTDKITDLSKLSRDDTFKIMRQEVLFGRKMKATLTDPFEGFDPRFRISDPIKEQLVDLVNQKSVDWIWDVYPLKTGRHKLNLTLEVFIIDDFMEGSQYDIVFNDYVEVYIDNPVATLDIPQEFDIEAMISDDTSSITNNNQRSVQQENRDPTLIKYIFSGFGVILLVFFLYTQYSSGRIKLNTNPSKRVDKISKLIQDGKIKEALQNIIKSIPKEEAMLMKDATAQLSRWNRITKDHEFGIMGEENFNIESSRVTQATITLLNELKNKK